MVKICQKQIGKQLLYREMHSNYKGELYIRSLWLNTGYTGVSKCFDCRSRVSDLAKVGGCEKFIEGQKVIILTRVTSNTPSSGQRNSGGHWHVLKYPVVEVTCNIPAYSQK